jgi:hypothetical protein
MKIQRASFFRGVCLIFGTYFYFLIFAQFAFVEIVRKVDPTEPHVQKILTAMAAGGLAGSGLIPILLRREYIVPYLLRTGFIGCAFAGILIYFKIASLIMSSVLIGFTLGITTVTLATSLRHFFSSSNWAFGSALGTGLAYVAANVPFIFQATPEVQTLWAIAISGCAALMVPHFQLIPGGERPASAMPVHHIIGAIVFFGILVWFDSAAFYIIQHSALKSGTWGSTPELWRNAVVHFAAAIGGALMVIRLGFFRTLGVAFTLLALGGLSANQFHLRPLSGWLYPAGVSIYSACLVAFPSFGTSNQPIRRGAFVAAALYAVSGWICSGLGIGMAQNLGLIPWQFVTLSAFVIFAPRLWNRLQTVRRELAWCGLVLFAAALATNGLRNTPAFPNSIEIGRAVYIAEGCINCHSQFVKPGSRDELLWGPSREIEQFAKDAPPLFGNRRQGPDLMNIGNRRSRDWLKIHFTDPRALAPGSSMPAYDYLLPDERADALIDYLLSLKSDQPRDIGRWSPATNCSQLANIELVFRQQCAMCHVSAGQKIELPSVIRLKRPPPDLAAGPFVFAPLTLPAEVRKMQIARIIKFGIAGTDMPGHEYFSDETVFALACYLDELPKR